MSHIWSGFGLLLSATILNTTALTMRIERIQGRTTISALRVVISPRNSIPACHPGESLASTLMLLIWALHFIAPGNVTIGQDRGQEFEYPIRYIASLLLFFFSISIVSAAVSSSTGRIGMLCFFEASWLHLFLHVWFFRSIVVRLRYGTKKASNGANDQGMERVIDAERSGLSSEAQKTVASAIISIASLAILIVYNLPGINMDGGLVFWEFWLALSSTHNLIQEWSYAD